jgi:hypothetical protein
MLDVFYGAFSPTCLTLLGLWLVVVQIRLREWQGSAIHRRRAYGVSLYFALPGIMSLLALIAPQDATYWRVSFAIVALGGAVVLALVRGLPARNGPGPAAAGPAAAGTASRPDRLGLAAYLAAIVLYIVIGALAFVGGLAALRIEAMLLTVMVFLGFNVAWLLLFDDRPAAHTGSPATAH